MRRPVSKNAQLVTLTDPRSPASEAYRTLRTNLGFASLTGELKTVVVTSPGPDEGKSTTLANLAVVMAQADHRVILVDADLRRPSQHLLFDVSNEQGLMTMMMDDAKMQTPPLVATEVEGLWLLLSGPQPPNPAELLSSAKMDQIIETLAERADIVLFDAPPVMPVTDAAILASKTDGVLLVLQAGTTKREHARQARERLEQVNARLVGSVLTNVELDATSQPYG